MSVSFSARFRNQQHLKQTIYNFAGAGEQVVFDIFRFDADDKIAEHWDKLVAKAKPNSSAG